MQLYMTTTGTQDPVIFEDLGYREYGHPQTDYQITNEFLYEELINSEDFIGAIYSGYITVKNDRGDTLSEDDLVSEYLLNIEKDDSTVVQGADILNFEGNVNIINEGNEKVTINVPFGGNGAFGSEFIYQNSEAESATSSTSYKNKIDYMTQTLPIGTYRFAFCAEGRISNSSKKCKIRLIIDDVEYIYSSSQGIGQVGYRLSNGFVYADFLTESAHTIKVQWCSNHHTKTAYIRRARIEGWRIS